MRETVRGYLIAGHQICGDRRVAAKDLGLSQTLETVQNPLHSPNTSHESHEFHQQVEEGGGWVVPHKTPMALTLNQYREMRGSIVLVIALFEFEADAVGDLSFKKGQMIEVKAANDEWYQGYYYLATGKQVYGNFPKNHVQKCWLPFNEEPVNQEVELLLETTEKEKVEDV
jgi:hypothetical protein